MINYLINFFTSDSVRSYKLSFIFLIVFIVSLVVIIIDFGFPPIHAMPWDIIIQLDAAWRIVSNQIPNVDFSLTIPPFSAMLTALMMKLTSPSISSITYGNLLLFTILTPWAWFIARTRLSAAIAFLFAIFIGIVIVAPRALGDLTQATSYAMIYNRQSWVLTSMLFVELLILPKQSLPKREVFSGLSSGILLALLLFCKLSFFIIGIAALLIRIVFFCPRKTWFVVVISSFLFVWLSIQSFFHWNLLAYLEEMKAIAPVYSSSRGIYWYKVYNKNAFYIGLIVFNLAVLLLSNFKYRNSNKKRKWLVWIVLVPVFVINAGLILCLGSAQSVDIPLFFIAGLILFNYAYRDIQDFGEGSIHHLSIVNFFISLITILFFWGSLVIQDAGSIAYSVWWNHSQRPSFPESEKFQSKTLSDFIIPPFFLKSSIAQGIAVDYPPEIKDGLLLLKEYISEESRITTLGFSNPFPFALQLPPPDGGVIAYGFGLTFNNQSFPAPDHVFKGANMVMIPTSASKISRVKELEPLYKDYLNQHFIQKGNSHFWTLWIKQ